MRKRIFCIIAMIAVFSAFFVGCNNTEGKDDPVFNDPIAEYKETAGARIQLYADLKVEANYTPTNWQILLQAAADGMTAVNNAETYGQIDEAVLDAEQSIKSVPKEQRVTFTEIESDGIVDCSQFYYSSGISWTGMPMTLSYEDERAVFGCSVIWGAFGFIYESPTSWSPVKEKTLGSGDGFYWRYDLDESILADRDLIDIIIELDKNIVGYAVIEIYRVDTSDIYNDAYMARVLKSAVIPKIDGKYQSITDAQIKAALEQMR